MMPLNEPVMYCIKSHQIIVTTHIYTKIVRYENVSIRFKSRILFPHRASKQKKKIRRKFFSNIFGLF